MSPAVWVVLRSVACINLCTALLVEASAEVVRPLAVVTVVVGIAELWFTRKRKRRQ